MTIWTPEYEAPMNKYVLAWWEKCRPQSGKARKDPAGFWIDEYNNQLVTPDYWTELPDLREEWDCMDKEPPVNEGKSNAVRAAKVVQHSNSSVHDLMHLEEQVKHLSNREIQLEQRITQQHLELDDLKQKLRRSEENFKLCQAANNAFARGETHLRNSLEEKRKKNTMMSEHNIALRKDNKRLRELDESQKESIAEQRRTCKNLRSRIEELEGLLTSTNRRLEEELVKHNVYQEEMDARRPANWAARETNLERKVTELQEAGDHLAEVCEARAVTIKQLKQTISNMESCERQYESMVKRLQKTANERIVELNRLRSENERLEEQTKEIVAVNERLNKEVKGLTRDKERLERIEVSLRDKIKNLDGQVRERELRVADLLKHNGELIKRPTIDKYQGLQQQNKDFVEVISRLNRDRNTLLSQVQDLQRRIDQLLSEM